MPVDWIPKLKSVETQIIEEETRLWNLKTEPTPQSVVPDRPLWQPTFQPDLPQTLPAPAIPPAIAPSQRRVVSPVVETPEIDEIERIAEEAPANIPFWQRALQVFAAPFNWVDETIIRPGLAVAATGIGAIEDVERKPGEDFFDWKRRSWAKWEAPGIDLAVPWSDEPWRIDLKGVLEFAPWLLIPGAGQVGGGVRAARGVAGILGRLGTAGRALGYAVEFSPWGLVEKTAGVALRASARAVGKGAGALSAGVSRKLFGEITEETTTPAVQKLTKFFNENIVPARKVFEEALPALRAKQLSNIERVSKLYRAGRINDAQYNAALNKATQVGGIRKGFAVKADIPEAEVHELLKTVAEATERGFTEKNTYNSLYDMLLGIDLPEPAQITELGKIFGRGFADSVRKFAQGSPTGWDKVIDAANIPRAALTMGDLSATLRQGLMLLITRPQDFPRAFWRQLKYFTSEKLSLQMDDVLQAKAVRSDAISKMGVELTSFQKGAKALSKEEPFFSTFAEKLPLVRRSERAYTGFLNEMRFSAAEAAYNSMVSQNASPQQLKLMGNFINLASGRGKLPKSLEKFAPALSTIFFSPKYQLSTLGLPRQIGRMLISDNPYMRKQAAQSLVGFIGGGAAILGLIKANGGEVEIDPRSGDFVKIKIGDTRLDIWRGFVQYARFGAQMLTGERKSAFGNMNKARRDEIAWRFLQSKSSPIMGLLVDMLRGETYLGDDLFTSTKSTIRSARERLLPLAVQDVMDAMEQSGINGIWTAAPATLGVGVMTYVNDFTVKKDKVAKDMGYETWDEIDPAAQRRIENSNAELQAAYIEFDRKVMGTAWGDWRLAGNAVEDNFKIDVQQATLQYQASDDPNKGITFREKITDAWTARRGGYAAREKMPQFEDIVKRLGTEDTAEALIGLGPEQLAIRAYNDALYGDEMYDEFGDYRFDLADIRKDQLRSQLGEEMFNYVETYRGIRHESLSSEFQELAQAKRVMRPYWDVMDYAIRTRGQAWADSKRGQAFISRMRKQMRLTDPEISKYYDMFYRRT